MTAIRRNMIQHGYIWAYICIATAAVVGFVMIEHEVNTRQGADKQIRKVIEIKTDAETMERTEANEKQIAALRVVNARQNTIIKALLKARGSNPDLFDGALLPGDNMNKTNAEQSSASTGDTIPARTGSGTSAAPQPRGDTPSPTITAPTPSHSAPTPDTNKPEPVSPAPASTPPMPTPTPPSTSTPPVINLPGIPLPSICLATPLLPCLLK